MGSRTSAMLPVHLQPSKSILLLLLWLALIIAEPGDIRIESSSPTYCIDPAILDIVSTRAAKCLAGGTTHGELILLRNMSTTDYHRSHELLAYQYFVENKQNIHRRSCSEADFEYIPLLPLSWRSGYPTSTTCTAGGFCPISSVIGDPSCSMKGLIEGILSIVEHVKTTRKQLMSDGIPKFTVASTYNLRTAMAVGLPSQGRSGPIYNAVTSFVTNTILGHYERQPQCPDVLRKQWRIIVEIPFVSLFDRSASLSLNSPLTSSSSSSSSSSSRSLAITQPLSPPSPPSSPKVEDRSIKFLFSGRLLLWLPDRVCSIRHVISTLTRPDLKVINITESQSYGPINEGALGYIHKSEFCLVTKADSFSSAFFYDAVHAGCIPVVISDWFVFAFPSAIPYKKFTIRISEDDFLTDPNGVLDRISQSYSSSQRNIMRMKMKRWVRHLSFVPSTAVVNGTYVTWSDTSRSTILGVSTRTDKADNDGSQTVKNTVVPFELMLREMRYHYLRAEKEKSITAKQAVNSVEEVEIIDRYCYNPLSCATRVPPMTLTGLNDTRSYMCAQKPRLIGRYKIMFYLQCVRILWPITPGKLKPSDLVPGALSPQDISFINTFHNVSKNTTVDWYGSWVNYPTQPNPGRPTYNTHTTRPRHPTEPLHPTYPAHP